VLDNQDLELIRDELNVKQVELWADVEQYTTVIAKPNPAVLGPKFKGDTPRIIQAARAGEFEQLADGRIIIGGIDAWTLPREDVEIHYEGNPGYACEASQDLVVVLDVQLTQELEREGLARELVRHIQILRKEANYRIDERITAGVFTTNRKVLEVLSKHGEHIRSETLSRELLTADDRDWDASQQVRVNDAEVRFGVRGARANNPGLTG
jgi:isoleucyl-tRNA synthetase